MITDTPAPGAESIGDPLAACLAQVARLLGQPMSAQALVTGLPVDAAGLSPALFARAAERAGLSARTIEIALARFPKLSLPAVLLLKDRNACVLVARGESDAQIVTAEGSITSARPGSPRANAEGSNAVFG